MCHWSEKVVIKLVLYNLCKATECMKHAFYTIIYDTLNATMSFRIDDWRCLMLFYSHHQHWWILNSQTFSVIETIEALADFPETICNHLNANLCDNTKWHIDLCTSWHTHTHTKKKIKCQKACAIHIERTWWHAIWSNFRFLSLFWFFSVALCRSYCTFCKIYHTISNFFSFFFYFSANLPIFSLITVRWVRQLIFKITIFNA